MRSRSVASSSVLLAGEVENHEGFLAVFPPRPGFRDVSIVVKMKNQVMLMPRIGRLQVARALIVEAEFLDVVGLRDDTRTRLVVGRAVVHQGDAVAVDTV